MHSFHGPRDAYASGRAAHQRMVSPEPCSLDRTRYCKSPFLLCFFTSHATVFRALHSLEPALSSISSPFRCTSSTRSACMPRQVCLTLQRLLLPAHAFVFTALAAVTLLRSIAGFAFPLFAPQMYKVLGFGKGDTILAAVAIVIGCPA